MKASWPHIKLQMYNFHEEFFVIFFSPPSCCERLGLRLEYALERRFSAWGRFCVRRPWLVLITGLLFCGVCSAGIVLFKVTTEPVELWSAPDSQARLQKDYFDNHFT